MNDDQDYITVEIEINNKHLQHSSSSLIELINIYNTNVRLNTYTQNAKVQLHKSKLKNTFLQSHITSSSANNQNYIKISLNSNSNNNITLSSLLDCLELINDPTYEIYFTKQNLISYLYAFTICKLTSYKDNILSKLRCDLDNEMILPFTQAISSLKLVDHYSFIYFLLKHIINIQNGYNGITYNNVNYSDVFKNKSTKFSKIKFDSQTHSKIIYNNTQCVNISFLNEYHSQFHKKKYLPFTTINNYFNVGKITRIKSDENLLDDYPHYYQMQLENDVNINIYAMRESENAKFIFSSNRNDFMKYSVNYLGEVEVNFWGTEFTVYDNGYDEQMCQQWNGGCVLGHKRRMLGKITYDTNIMGECPRSFVIKTYEYDDEGRAECVEMENVEPKFSEKMGCYCLNFYGRVKKASAKNFQVIVKGEEEDILLQHGKVSKNVFNIDYREPFCHLMAFGVSLAGIGKKRVVS